MAGEIIRQGDRTSHGGTVLEGSLADICHGKPIAYVGHKVMCPKCKGVFPIVEGVLTTTFYGKGVAIAGMKTACGASLIATQFTDIVEVSGGAANGASQNRTNTPASENRAASPAATVPASAPAAGETVNQAKSIKRIFWTYGPNELPLEGISRHYVDLNLHLETENYAPGDTAQIVLKNDDGSELVSGSETIRLQAVVGADGSAKLMNVFKNNTVEIGVIT
jgi:uncharacterized Zn-binding protein involved in type VI secretion